MSDIVKIRIGGDTVGIVGLQDTLAEVAETLKGEADETIREDLLTRLAKRNFISTNEKVREQYGQAFLREYKKFVGEPFAAEKGGGVEIRVLGPGCPQCERLEQEVMAAMAETGIAADLEHVRDLKEIGRYGVMGSPALVINGEVKAVGAVPAHAKLRAWIVQAATR